MRFTRTLAIPALLLLLFSLPLQALASPDHKTKKHTTCKPVTTRTAKVRSMSSMGGTVITFGITGGNIVPWSVSIDSSGAVTSTGWIKPHNAKLADPNPTLNGLFTLANAEGFFTMPSFTNCSGTLPDIASRYIQMSSSSGTSKVTVHGTCVQKFNELFGVLENATDIQH